MKGFFKILFIVSILLTSCGEKMPLPDITTSIDSFGANDTSYTHITPDWNSGEIGYSPANPMEPVDISIGKDDLIFIADKANNRIIVVTKAGQLATHQNLNTIFPIENPVGIDIDSKLHLLIVNGSNKIYAWNQYINNIGVNSVIVGIDENDELIFSSDPALIDSITGIFPIYVDPDQNTSFRSVAFGPADENVVYATDNSNNRIMQLNLQISTGVKLSSNALAPMFTLISAEDIVSFGSGAGTVDNPQSITCDDDGNIYFTQLGGNFLVQKLVKGNGSFTPGYTLYKDPIMDLGRFQGPQDIAIGKDNAIFVIDTPDSGRVSKFFNKGAAAGQVSNLGNVGLANARFLKAQSIAVSDDEVVYIANTSENRIDRYQYSISESNIPQEPQ